MTAAAVAHLVVGLLGDPVSDAAFMILGPLHVFIVLMMIGAAVTVTTVLCGWFAGMTFDLATVGPLLVSGGDGSLRVGINQEWKGFHGMIHMMPPREGFTLSRALCYLGAGTLASAPVAVAAVYLGSTNGWGITGGSLPDGIAGMFLYWFVVAALYVLVVEFAKGGVIVVHLLTQPRAGRQQNLAFIGAASHLANGDAPRALDPATIIEVIGTSDESVIRAMGLALAYVHLLDAGRIDAAARSLDEVQRAVEAEGSGHERKTHLVFLGPYISVYHELAFITALVDRDVEVATRFLFLGRKQRIPRLTAIRTGMALLIADGDEEGAARLAREAVDDREPMPPAARWRVPFERRIVRQLLSYEMHQTDEVRALIAEIDALTAAADLVSPAGRPIRSVVRSLAGAAVVVAFAWVSVLGAAVAFDTITGQQQPDTLFGESTRVDLGRFLEKPPDLSASPVRFDPLPEIMREMSQDEVDYVTAIYWHHERIARGGDRGSILDFVPFGKKRRLLAQATLWQSTYRHVVALSPPPDYHEFHDRFVEGLRGYAQASQDVIAYYGNHDREGLSRATEHAERGYALIVESSEQLEWILGYTGADGTSDAIIDALLTTGDLGGDWYLQSLFDDDGLWWGPILPCSGDPAYPTGIDEISLVRMATSGEPKRYLRQMIAQADVSESSAVIGRVRSSLTCGRWVDGEGDVYVVSPLETPRIGHDSVAYRVRFPDDDRVGPWDSHVVLARHANVVIEVWHYDTAGEPDLEQTIEIVERALQRVRDSGLTDEMLGIR